MDSTETSSDPWSSSTERNELKAGIDDRDSRNVEEVSFADIAGVVKNLNEKICLLRREILELRNCGRVSVVRKSSPEIIKNGNPSGSESRDRLSVKNLGLTNFIRRITPLYFLEKISRINESKGSTSSSNLSILSNHYVYETSQYDVPFKSETQNEKGIVYVVGSQVKSRSASPFKPDKDSKIRKRLPGKRSAGGVSGDADHLGRGEKKILNEPEEIKKGRENNAPGDKIRSKRGDNANKEEKDANETTNTSENCLSGGTPCVERKRIGNWKKSMKPVKLNKCADNNCYGKRVRKRISRGVQTAPKKRCRIINLLHKFRWRLRKKKRRKEEFSTAGETLSNKVSAADIIYEPSGASARSDKTISNVESSEITLEKNDDKKREGKQESDDFLSRDYKKNIHQPTSVIVDGTKIETEKNVSVTKKKKWKPHKNISNTGSKADLGEKKANLGGRNRSKKDKRNGGNLSSSDVETSNHVSESVVDESKSRESVKQKNDQRIDKTKSIRRKCKKKPIKTVNEAQNSEEKDSRLVEGKIDKRDNRTAEKPAEKRRTKRSRNRKNPPTSSKTFNDTVRNSLSQQRPSFDNENQNRRDEQLNARKNEIADVKRRLDACIDDLNDIILTLSKLYRDAPASRGPDSEGTQSKKRNSSPQNRSRLR